MTKEALAALKLPDTPGVYFFLSEQKKVLYIGKATSLQNRVRSYFAHNIHEVRSPLIANMVAEAASLEWTETDSVLEALILETNLIRSHKPPFNTKSKDDKSYNHVIITKEEWPRLLVVRGKDITERFEPGEIAYHFGPFPSAGVLREALQIIRKIFKFYDTKRPIGTERTKLEKGRITFNQQIGLYPHTTDRAGYLRTIRHLRLFFQGKKQLIVADITKLMHAAAKKQAFEEASVWKRKLQALKHIEDIALIKASRTSDTKGSELRIEAYDVAHLQGRNMVGVMVVFEHGTPAKDQYRRFKISSVTKANDPAALTEVLTRRLTHLEWPMPTLVVVDGNEVQKRAAELVLATKAALIPVVAVTKDERHKPKDLIGDSKIIKRYKLEILHANAEAHRFSISYHRARERKGLTGDNKIKRS